MRALPLTGLAALMIFLLPSEARAYPDIKGAKVAYAIGFVLLMRQMEANAEKSGRTWSSAPELCRLWRATEPLRVKSDINNRAQLRQDERIDQRCARK